MSVDCEWFPYSAYIPQIRYHIVDGSGYLSQCLSGVNNLGDTLGDTYTNTNTILGQTENIESNHDELVTGLTQGFKNVISTQLLLFGFILAVLARLTKKFFPSSTNYLKFSFSYTFEGMSYTSNFEFTNGFLNDEENTLVAGVSYDIILYFPYEAISVKNIAKTLLISSSYVIHSNWLLQSLCLKVLGKKYTDQLLRVFGMSTEV